MVHQRSYWTLSIKSRIDRTEGRATTASHLPPRGDDQPTKTLRSLAGETTTVYPHLVSTPYMYSPIPPYMYPPPNMYPPLMVRRRRKLSSIVYPSPNIYPLICTPLYVPPICTLYYLSVHIKPMILTYIWYNDHMMLSCETTFSGPSSNIYSLTCYLLLLNWTAVLISVN